MPNVRSTIICVDDDNWMLSVLADLLVEWLGSNYCVEKALSGAEALEIIDNCYAEGMEVSLVISDYIMPGMKGDEVLTKVKAKDPAIRRIMLTGYAALDGVINAINNAGIYRYLSKPWDNKDMMLTVLQAIRSYEQEKRSEKLTKSYEDLYKKFERLANTLQVHLTSSLYTLAAAVETREAGEKGHSLRVAKYAALLGKAYDLSDDALKTLDTIAIVHEVGKIALSDDELQSIRSVVPYDQPEIIKRQAEGASAILSGISNAEKIRPAVMLHMEKYDGTGVFGVSGASIPIEARIISIANYYDAMYNGKESPDVQQKLLAEMAGLCGKLFDEKLFAKFKEVVTANGFAKISVE